MENDTCTAQEREAIVDEAQRRKTFLLWLATRLETSDMFEYRLEAAKALRQLVEAP